MVQLSKKRVERSVWNRIFILFFEIIGRRKNKKDFDDIVSGVLSYTERIMIGKRIAVVYMLIKGMNTGTICNTLKVTRSTVAKFAYILEENQETKKLYKSVITKDSLIDLFAEIYINLKPPGMPGNSWKESWEIKNFLQQKKQRGI